MEWIEQAVLALINIVEAWKRFVLYVCNET